MVFLIHNIPKFLSEEKRRFVEFLGFDFVDVAAVLVEKDVWGVFGGCFEEFGDFGKGLEFCDD